MTIVGITGPSGAGKSFFCSHLACFGCLVLDCDRIYHELVDVRSDCTRAIAAEPEFGTHILKSDGSLDRKTMAAIVFAPGAESTLAKLNKITHAFVLSEVRNRISQTPADCPAVIIDAPLLFQADFDRECDLTCAILASPELRLQRLTERDAQPQEALKARLAAAPDDNFYREKADVIIVNEGDSDKLALAAKNFFEEYCRT